MAFSPLPSSFGFVSAYSAAVDVIRSARVEAMAARLDSVGAGAAANRPGKRESPEDAQRAEVAHLQQRRRRLKSVVIIDEAGQPHALELRPMLVGGGDDGDVLILEVGGQKQLAARLQLEAKPLPILGIGQLPAGQGAQQRTAARRHLGAQAAVAGRPVRVAVVLDPGVGADRAAKGKRQVHRGCNEQESRGQHEPREDTRSGRDL